MAVPGADTLVHAVEWSMPVMSVRAGGEQAMVWPREAVPTHSQPSHE